MEKIYKVISWLTIISAGLLIILFGCWWTYPYKTVEFKTDKFRVITKEVKPSGKLVYEINACKYMETKPKVSVIYANGIHHLASDTFSAISMGCHVTLVERTVPNTLLPSKYHLEVTIEYQVNPIRTITQTIKSEEFLIIK